MTKELQRDTTSLSDIQDLFDAVVKEFHETKNRLRSRARIILCPLFEHATVKIQEGNLSAVSTDEKGIATPL